MKENVTLMSLRLWFAFLKNKNLNFKDFPMPVSFSVGSYSYKHVFFPSSDSWDVCLGLQIKPFTQVLLYSCHCSRIFVYKSLFTSLSISLAQILRRRITRPKCMNIFKKTPGNYFQPAFQKARANLLCLAARSEAAHSHNQLCVLSLKTKHEWKTPQDSTHK